MKQRRIFITSICFIIFAVLGAYTQAFSEEYMQSLNIDSNKKIGDLTSLSINSEISTIAPSYIFLSGKKCINVENFRQIALNELVRKIEVNNEVIKLASNQLDCVKCQLDIARHYLSLYEYSNINQAIDSTLIIFGNINAHLATASYFICLAGGPETVGVTCVPALVLSVFSVWDFTNDLSTMDEKQKIAKKARYKLVELESKYGQLMDKLENDTSLKNVIFDSLNMTINKDQMNNFFKIEKEYCLPDLPPAVRSLPAQFGEL